MNSTPASNETLERLYEVRTRIGALDWFMSVYIEQLQDENLKGISIMLGDLRKELNGCLEEMKQPCRRCHHE